MKRFTDEQEKFLKAEGKVVVKACPGSGKTYSVANKLLNYLQTWKEPHQGVAVLSFTNVASEEISYKLSDLNTTYNKIEYPHYIGTVDSFINEFIVLRYGHLITKDRVRPIIALKDSWNIPYSYWRQECRVRGCVDHIEEFRYGVAGGLYRGNEKVKCEPRGKALILPCQKYKLMLYDKNVIFQNEVSFYAYNILKKYTQIKEAIIDRFPVIIIDEAQDISEEQMVVFDLLVEAGIKSIFLVGDPDQAIYEWRNASPDCFKNKAESSMWSCIELNNNFRSSQNICNATCYFAESLKGKNSNIAVGEYKNESTKPILLQTKDTTEEDVIKVFLDKCRSMDIDITPQNVAVLTRGRIYVDTDVEDLWKNKDIELFAKASYEWNYGSRKKAYNDMAKASYRVLIGEEVAEHLMMQNIVEYIDEEKWKDFIVEVFANLPDINISIAEWVKEFADVYCKIISKYNLRFAEGRSKSEVFKIKRSDKKKPQFKEVPMKKFFEKKKEEEYTKSSIHGVKGETYEAVLMYIKSKQGNTITPKLLMEGNLDKELMRIAYVAMTRPRRLLMIAMPETNKIEECERFSEDVWEYQYM